MSQEAKDKVRRFMLAVMDAAVFDADNGEPDYCALNSGVALLERLNLEQHRSDPRNGDAKYARSLYTAARFLYKTETTEPEVLPRITTSMLKERKP